MYSNENIDNLINRANLINKDDFDHKNITINYFNVVSSLFSIEFELQSNISSFFLSFDLFIDSDWGQNKSSSTRWKLGRDTDLWLSVLFSSFLRVFSVQHSLGNLWNIYFGLLFFVVVFCCRCLKQTCFLFLFCFVFCCCCCVTITYYKTQHNLLYSISNRYTR